MKEKIQNIYDDESPVQPAVLERVLEAASEIQNILDKYDLELIADNDSGTYEPRLKAKVRTIEE